MKTFTVASLGVVGLPDEPLRPPFHGPPRTGASAFMSMVMIGTPLYLAATASGATDDSCRRKPAGNRNGA